MVCVSSPRCPCLPVIPIPDDADKNISITQGLALNKTFVNMLKYQLFIPKRIVGVIRWLLVAVGTLGGLACLVFHFKEI
ncbi:unnamed protein product, partial [Leptidea sinapis]